MDVSIVIVSFNVSNLLNDCLLSIKKETNCQYEIIVVDNNSKDDSVEIVRAHHSDVKLIQNQRNVGFAKANNAAFRETRGRYIFMLNPDTIVLDGAIDKLVRFMNEHPEVGVCGPKNVNPDLSLQHNCHHFTSLSMIIIKYLKLERFFPHNRCFGRWYMTYWKYNEIKEVDWITGCSLMIRKEVLDKVGYLDENYFMYSEEGDFCYRLKKHKLKTVFYPYASIVHYDGQSSLEQNDSNAPLCSTTKYLFRSRYYFFEKNYGRAMEFLLRVVDITYFSLLQLKNKIMFAKKNRQERIILAKVALHEALTHLLHDK